MSNLLTLNAFATPIFVLNLGEQSRSLNKELIEDINSEKINDPNRVQRTGINVWQSQSNLEERYDSFKRLLTISKKLIDPLLLNTGVSQEDIDESLEYKGYWANVNNNPNAYHIPHLHGRGTTLFSCVYYPTTGFLNSESLSEKENLEEEIDMIATSVPEPGSLVLHDPAYSIKSQVATPNLKKYPYFGLSLALKPREGLLVVFPNYLLHSVTPTEKENFTRISIAFRIDIKND